MAVITALVDGEEIIVLFRRVGDCRVEARLGRIGRRLAARSGAVGRHIEIAVRMPDEIIGIAHAGGVDAEHGIRGERIVECRMGAVRIEARSRRLIARVSGDTGLGLYVEPAGRCIARRIYLDNCRIKQAFWTVPPRAVGSASRGVGSLAEIEEIFRLAVARSVIGVTAELQAVGQVVAT
ncbi:hypothetical protein D3C71_742420 [compost metagenome]